MVLRRIELFAVAAALVATSCAKPQENRVWNPWATPATSSTAPTANTPSPTTSEITPEAVAVTVPHNTSLIQTYEGKNLDLYFPHEKHLGLIKLTGADAEALYSALAVKAQLLPGNKDCKLARIRQGKQIACFSLTPKLAGQDAFQCNITLNYRTGEVSVQDDDVELERRDEPASGYRGKVVTTVGAHPSYVSEIKITGEDARQLYDALEIDPTVKNESRDWLPGAEKRSPDLRCLVGARRDTPDVVRYTCLLRIGHTAGSIVRK